MAGIRIRESNSGIECPSCGGTDSGVTDSRPTKFRPGIRRRRCCAGCGARFTTHEMLATDEERAAGVGMKATAEMMRESARRLTHLAQRIENGDSMIEAFDFE